ncbi:MAG TPA: lysyl oxidase family protein [Candidatus Acidoferrum sp.]|nr:lysyl oxidase family protein [Candidatus Acidoferrum sp.]
MNRSAWKTWGAAFLSVILISFPGAPLRSQQGACATQTGPNMPDLIVDGNLLRTQIFLSTETYGASTCTVREGCVSGPGKHLLLRFNGSTANIGKADLVIGDPGSCSTLFVFDECHQHYHFKDFAVYRVWTQAAYQTWVASRDLTQPASVGINAQLLDMAIANGQLVSVHKQGFCLTDDGAFLPTAGPAVFQNCFNNQGISVGWEDIYSPQLPCQFAQIDNLTDGTYVLEMHVNPEHVLPESDYTNNASAVTFQFSSKRGNTGPTIQVLP